MEYQLIKELVLDTTGNLQNSKWLYPDGQVAIVCVCYWKGAGL